MTYSIEERDRAVVIALDGDVEGGPAAAGVYEDVRQLCARGHVRFVVDLENATGIDAQGLGALIGLLTLTRNAGGDLVLASAPGFVRSLLFISGLQEAVPSVDTVDAAMSAVASAGAAE